MDRAWYDLQGITRSIYLFKNISSHGPYENRQHRKPSFELKMLSSEDLLRNVYILAGKENLKEKFINMLV